MSAAGRSFGYPSVSTAILRSDAYAGTLSFGSLAKRNTFDPDPDFRLKGSGSDRMFGLDSKPVSWFL